MDTIWGCDPEQMDELVETLVERAERLIRLIELLRDLVATVTWTGPDADAFRESTAAAMEAATAVARRITACGGVLSEEARAQDRASCADGPAGVPGPGGGLAVGAGLSGLVSRGHDLVGRVASGLRGLEEVWDPRLLGGPLAGPVVGPAPGPGQAPAAAPLPEDEAYGLDPDRLERAQAFRESVIGEIPYAAEVQSMLSAHTALGNGLDSAEQSLEDNGLGFATPLVTLARIPHATSGAMIGENSALGQVAAGIDRSFANVAQTTSEITDALGEGDLAGAARAAERGAYRGVEYGMETLMPSPVPTFLDATANGVGALADLAEPVHGGTADALRGVEDLSRHRLEQYERFTDSERVYDARRQYVRLPWDHTG